jgi:hypothetical protein
MMEPAGAGPARPHPAPAAAGRGWSWLRPAAIGVLAGLVAGLVIGGAGGRLAMRLVVLATDRLPTQSGEGTLGILLVGAVLGTTLGLLYAALRRWLPRGWRAPGLIYGLLLLTAPGVAFFVEGLFHAESELREGPLALGVGLFSALIVGYGLAVAGLVDAFDRRLPIAGRQPAALAGYSAVTLAGLACALLGGTMLAALLASAVSLLVTGQPVRLPALF